MDLLRSALIVATAVVVPHPVIASTCSDFRPNWDGGSVSAWSEMIQLFGTPISLILLLGTALAVRFRKPWAALAVFVGWSFAVAAVTFLDPTGGVRAAAAAEGCVGSPSLYIAVVFALCGAMMVYLNKMADRDQNM